MSDSLQEYERQLAEIEEMLAASPDDPSLLSLKADLLELIATTLGTTTTTTTTTEEARDNAAAHAAATVPEEADSSNGERHNAHEEPADLSQWNAVNHNPPKLSAQTATTLETTVAGTANDTTTTTAAKVQPVKKKKKVKSNNNASNAVFTIPADLEIKANDSKFEVKRKKRAQQALRKQFDAAQEARTATAKQQSWQAFAQRKGSSSSSMFQTDASAKVGVVGQRRFTKFEGPKKHK